MNRGLRRRSETWYTKKESKLPIHQDLINQRHARSLKLYIEFREIPYDER